MTFRFFLRRATDWAPEGHEVAWQQLALPTRARRRAVPPAAAPSKPGLLEAAGTRAVVEPETGILSELSVDGRNVLVAGPRLQLWRAPTDNDGLRLLPERRSGVLSRWLELGLDRVEQRVQSHRVTKDRIEVVHRASGRDNWDDAVHTTLLSTARLGRPAGRERGAGPEGVARPAARRRRPHAPARARAARVVRRRPVGELSGSARIDCRRPLLQHGAPTSTCRTSFRRSTVIGAT